MQRRASSRFTFVVTALILVIFLIVKQNHTERISHSSHRGSMEDRIDHDSIHKDLDPELFRFVPRDVSRCQELHPGVSRNFVLLWHDDIQRKHRDFIKAVAQRQERLEGHSGLALEQVLTYIHLVRAPFVRTVCETGFNAGHSTFTWLASNPAVHVYSFDIGEHHYSRPLAQLLSTMFPGRLTMTWGDSLQTLPEFRKSNPDVRCDLIIVDGGHTKAIAQADMDNFRQMANKTNVIVLDDYPIRSKSKRTLGVVWDTMKTKHEMREIFSCSFLPERKHGFSVGQFLL